MAVLVGPKGRGSNMAALHQACVDGRVDAEVVLVMASNDSSPALARAKELGIAAAAVPSEGILEALRASGVDVVCLAGYLRLLPSEVLHAFPNRVLNIHPALLPKFGGKGMYGIRVHEAVLAAGETESGCTVHLVSEHYDEGAIVLQKRCPVLPDDTAETLASRVLELEHETYPEALRLMLAANQEVLAQRSVENTEVRLTDPESEKRPQQFSPKLQHPLFTYVAVPLMRAVCWVVFTLLGPFRAVNRRAIPRSGGLLILANHRADIDPIVLQLACPRPIYFMAKSELFGIRMLGKLIRAFRAFPVRRGEPDRSSIKTAVAYAHLGQAVGIFPEGQLTETGELQSLKPGAALIVRMAGVPVVCCGIRDTDRILPYGKLLPRPAFGWVTCEWGEPRSFERHASTEEIVGWATAELRRLVRENG